MSEARPTNPYESPREPGQPRLADFSDRDSDLADLRRRVHELERRLERSWFHGGPWRRMLAVWAYFLLGYGLILGIGFALMWLFNLTRLAWD
jgi:hypothetical protein